MEAGARGGNGGGGERKSLRMRLKAPTWTLMSKATMDEGKSKITEVKVACWERKVKKLRARRENNSGRI